MSAVLKSSLIGIDTKTKTTATSEEGGEVMDKHEMIKNRIMSTSKEILDSSGTRSFTLSDICKRCRISKNTFYKYFSSKEELVHCLHNVSEPSMHDAESMTELIVANAKKLIFEKGYDNFDMSELASMVGIKRTTLYSYFSSSTEIAQYVLNNELKRREGFEQAVEAECKDSIDRFNRYVDYQLNLIDDEQITRLIIEMISNSSKNEKIRNRLNVIEDFSTDNLVELIDSGKKDHVFDSGLDSRMNASLIYMLGYGMIVHQHLHPGSGMLEELKPYISRFVINSLKAVNDEEE